MSSEGTSPYTFNWNTGVTTIGTSSTSPNLSANTYSVTVTDNKGCITTSSVKLTDPPLLLGQFTKGTATCNKCDCQEWLLINATGGTAPYTYQWLTFSGYDKRYKNKICPGNYTVNITDKNGCSVDVNITVP